jgi:hypothetical protein
MDLTYTFEEVQGRKETAKAYLCDIASSQFWVPKSQIIQFDEESGTLITTLWWADVSGAREAYERASKPRRPEIRYWRHSIKRRHWHSEMTPLR